MIPLSRAITAFPKDTPSTWKASAVIGNSQVPSAGTGFANARVIPLMSVSEMEFRERRLLIGVSDSQFVGNALTGPYNIVSPPIRASLYTPIAVGSIAQLASLGSAANVALRVECSGYAKNVLFCDVRNGPYRLPPCTEVKVSLYVTRPAAVVSFQSVTINAAIVDSCEGPVVRPTQSCAFSGAPPNTLEFYLNPLVRWIDCQPALGTGLSADPVLTLRPYYPTTNPGPTVIRDVANYRWFPSGDPVEFFANGQGSLAEPNTYVLAVTGTGVTPVAGTITQFLEW